MTAEGQGDDASSLSFISSHYKKGGSKAFPWLARIPATIPLFVSAAKKCLGPRVTKESERGRQPILPCRATDSGAKGKGAADVQSWEGPEGVFTPVPKFLKCLGH